MGPIGLRRHVSSGPRKILLGKLLVFALAALSMVLAGCLNLYETLCSYIMLVVLVGSALLHVDEPHPTKGSFWDLRAQWQTLRTRAAHSLIHKGFSMGAIIFLVVPSLVFGWALVSLRLLWGGDFELILRKLIQSTLDTLITSAFVAILTIGYRLFPSSDDPSAPPLLQDIQPDRVKIEEEAWKVAREETFYSEELGITVDNSTGTGLALAAHAFLSVFLFQLKFAIAGAIAFAVGLAFRYLGDFDWLRNLDQWPQFTR
jgi:hypothetical protein